MIAFQEQRGYTDIKMYASLLPRLILEIAAADDLDTALSLAVERICEATDWDYGEVWVPSPNGDYLQCSQSKFNRDSLAIAQLRTHSLEFIFPPNIGLPGRIWVTKKSEFYPDISKLSKNFFSRVEMAKKLGVKSGFGIPVVISNEVVAVILFFMLKSNPKNPVKLEMIQNMMPQLTVLLHQKQTEKQLKETTEKYRSIFENAVEGIFQTTADGRYLTVNPMLATIYGYDSPGEMMANLTDIEHQLYVNPQRRNEFRHLLEKQDAVWAFESEIYRKDGQIIWISECARKIRNAAGEIIGYEGTVVDITQRKQAEIELLKRDRLLEAVAAAMNELLLNPNHREAVNRGLGKLGEVVGVHRVYVCIERKNCDFNCELTGARLASQPSLIMEYEWTAEGISSAKTADHLLIPTDSKIFPCLLAGEPLTILTEQMSPGDRAVFGYPDVVSSLLVPIIVQEEFFGYVGFDDCQTARSWSKSEASILVAIAGSIGGAIQRHQQEVLIHHQAFHDLLTGLPNRQQLEQSLPKMLAIAQQQEQKAAFLFIDLDRFKIINDTLGHGVGDQLLQIVAQRLKQSLREDDMIIRWGGDEFIVILNQIHHSVDAGHIAQRIINSIQQSFLIDEHQLYISCSIGIAIYPEDGIDASTLMQNADLALYRVKETGRNSYEFYTPYMHSEIPEYLLLENNAEQALNQQEFLLFYQPLLHPTTREIRGVEALIRWQHPTLGLLPAEKFISLLEEKGFMVKLGRWILESACEQLSIWQTLGWPPVKVWINLSAAEFQQQNLLAIISEVLQATGVNPECLGLEINEATAMQDLEFTRHRLQQLHRMRIALALDNFGSGLVSLTALKSLPFDRIKIDRFFLKKVGKKSKELALLRTMIDLGNQLGFPVVIQGVETPEQQEILATFDCDEMQGNFLSPPLFASEANRLFSLPSKFHLS
ncbi:EAL domain-containing protein [Planktothricoides sp. SR001]|uniref:bifunctional diguanylate cyclase/phosphodiesterase n=1 Tax=Planktothricoides sp. SR001 TaxID=1705388 RepID=UPI0006C8D6F1|nr:EAL domain-containing protein [Planktothricoides sp. SR001]